MKPILPLWIFVLCFGLIGIHFSQPAPPGDPQNLVSFEVFNTPPYPQDGKLHTLTWQNQSGRALLVKKVYLWSGATAGTLADIGAYVKRTSDQSPLIYSQWDHYAAPVGPSGVTNSFDPYMLVMAGDGLTLTYQSSSGAVNARSQHVVVIWCLYR